LIVVIVITAPGEKFGAVPDEASAAAADGSVTDGLTLQEIRDCLMDERRTGVASELTVLA
jgi:hypothetical protein